MAGSYPDVPGYRFAYDEDGTVVAYYNILSGTSQNWGNDITRSLNSEDTESIVSFTNGNRYITFLFPEPRNITGIVINHGAQFTLQATEWSTNTTTGLDGTWHNIAGVGSLMTTERIPLRTNISSVAVANITALRTTYTGASSGTRTINNIHLYGSVAPAESPNRLRIVDLSDDDIVAQLDFGNIPQRTSSTRQFKVINNSALSTANSVTVRLDAPSDTEPSLLEQYQVSTDNIAFASAVNIGTLAPGASSGILYVRNQVANNAQLSVWSARIIAHPVSWS